MGQGNHYSLLLILLSLLLLPIPDSAATTPSSFTIKPSCESHCGIAIPYPFGIGKGCFLNEWYEIICNTSSGKPVPFLKKLHREVAQIRLPSRYRSQAIRIKSQITSLNCSRDVEPARPFNVTGSPFYLEGGTNSLVTVGCNIKASMTQVEREFVGCESNCNETNSRGEQSAICNGYKCCQASVSSPSSLQVVGVEVVSANPNSTEEGCRVAFLTDETYSRSNIGKPEEFYAKGYANITLEWHVDTSAPLYVNPSDCRNATDDMGSGNGNCQFYEYYLSGSSYRDYECGYHYTGNPYLPGGCKGVKSPPLWTVLGLSLGVGLLTLTIVIWWLCKFVRKRKEINRKKKFFKRNGGLLLQHQLTAAKGNVEKTKIFSCKEIEKATEKFSENRILGQGGHGTVYKGMLIDGRIVAVKKSKLVDEDNLEEFINEVVILSQINHRNIVKLLGCCLETEVPILVYEFIPNGNLFEHLHDQFDDYIMTWEVRLRIAIEISGALSYLHSAASAPVYHRDIKSTNILLDEKHRVKVSDFGTSRSVTIDHTHLTTIVLGTAGYVDPEYLQSNQFTDKSDVYSFGVVLVELITGEKPLSYLRPQEIRTLATHFILAMKEKKLFDIIDPRIKGDCEPEEVLAVAVLAKGCLNLSRKKRPNMREVSIELERIRTSPKDSKVQTQHEEEEEDEAVEINIGDSRNIAHTAPASDIAIAFSTDVEPLVPHQTW